MRLPCAPEQEQNPQFIPSAPDGHIAPNAQYSKSQNMCIHCNILNWVILIVRYYFSSLIFNISPLDNYSTLAKYMKFLVTPNSCVNLYVPVQTMQGVQIHP